MATYTPNLNLEKPDSSDAFGNFRESYNDNMDKIDAGIGSGGGHIIIDPNGTPMAQESGLQFAGNVTVTDDSVNGVTVVNVTGGGGGSVNDVLVNGVSVVDGNGDAQIVSYKEVTQAEYDALPSTKFSDGVLYAITDSFPDPTVSWNQIQASGDKIAEVTINGTTTDVYSPSVSGKADNSIIAPVLTTFQATATVKDKGTQFIYNGVLYEITTSVTAGTSFVVGTNVKVSDSITEQLEKYSAKIIASGTTIAQLKSALESITKEEYFNTFVVLTDDGINQDYYILTPMDARINTRHYKYLVCPYNASTMARSWEIHCTVNNSISYRMTTQPLNGSFYTTSYNITSWTLHKR